ncbi:hypothetical protein D3C80_1865700 [compost metagenome]
MLLPLRRGRRGGGFKDETILSFAGQDVVRLPYTGQQLFCCYRRNRLFIPFWRVRKLLQPLLPRGFQSVGRLHAERFPQRTAFFCQCFGRNLSNQRRNVSDKIADKPQ